MWLWVSRRGVRGREQGVMGMESVRESEGDKESEKGG